MQVVTKKLRRCNNFVIIYLTVENLHCTKENAGGMYNGNNYGKEQNQGNY